MLEYELGFSLVVQEMIRFKRPLVGHNLFLDLLFLYQQFIDDLPALFEDWVVEFQSMFPVVYDTKCIGTTLALTTKTDLNSMANVFQTNKKYKQYLEFEFDLAAGFNKYMSKSKLHEAGYDSYLTGICFASMIKYLEVQNLIEFQKQRGIASYPNSSSSIMTANQILQGADQ